MIVSSSMSAFRMGIDKNSSKLWKVILFRWIYGRGKIQIAGKFLVTDMTQKVLPMFLKTDNHG
jgi:hypothetical protein